MSCWFAVDCDGHVGRFDRQSAAGVPTGVSDDDVNTPFWDELSLACIRNVESRGIREQSDIDEWGDEAGSLSLFEYYVTQTNRHVIWPCTRFGSEPPAALRVDQLSAALRAVIERVRFGAICFAHAESLQPLEHVACEFGDAIFYLTPDLKLLIPIPGREEDCRRKAAAIRHALPREIAQLLPQTLTPGPGAPPLV